MENNVEVVKEKVGRIIKHQKAALALAFLRVEPVKRCVALDHRQLDRDLKVDRRTLNGYGLSNAEIETYLRTRIKREQKIDGD